MKRAIPSAILLMVIACPGVSHAQGKDEQASSKEKAKTLFLEGVAAFSDEKYPEALTSFKASYELNPNPNVLYNIGMCQRALLDFSSSTATLKKYLEKKGDSIPAKEKGEIETIISEMEASLGSLELAVSEEGATILVDSMEVGISPLPSTLELNPGMHTVEARKDGFAGAQKSFTLKSGEKTKLGLELAALKAAPPPEVVMETGKKAAADKAKKEEKKKSILKSPLLWSLLGVAIVGAGTATGLIIWKTGSGGSSTDDGDWVIQGK